MKKQKVKRVRTNLTFRYDVKDYLTTLSEKYETPISRLIEDFICGHVTKATKEMRQKADQIVLPF